MSTERTVVPDRIAPILRELERDIESDPFGRLSLGGRIRLWDAMRDEYGRVEGDLRWSILAYLVARQAVSGWAPDRLPRDPDFDRDFRHFPGLYLESVRLCLLGQVSRDRIKEIFHPLRGYQSWPEVSENAGYWEVLDLLSRLLDDDDRWYEDQEYFATSRGDDGRYREIFEDSEFDFDTHYHAAIGASGPGYGNVRGGPAEIVPRRAFWRRWIGETVPKVLGTRESVLAWLSEPAGPRPGVQR